MPVKRLPPQRIGVVTVQEGDGRFPFSRPLPLSGIRLSPGTSESDGRKRQRSSPKLEGCAGIGESGRMQVRVQSGVVSPKQQNPEGMTRRGFT